MTAYTSSGSGNWNNAATWGGGGYPASSADTATITAQHTVTIPTGVTIECGAITFGTGISATHTKLVIAGRLNMAGTMTLVAYGELYLDAGGVLDLAGQTITRSAAPAYYNFMGTSGSRATVISTGTRGVFGSYSGNLNTVAQYTDFSGLGDAEIGRGHTTASTFQSYQYCTFDDCDHLGLENLCNAANTGFLVSHCAFTNSNSVTPISDGYPLLYLSNAARGTGVRRVEYCTWDQDTGYVSPTFRAIGTDIRSCTFNQAYIYSTNGSSTPTHKNTFTGCFFKSDNTRYFDDSYDEFYSLESNFLYYANNDHPIGYQTATFTRYIGNILEMDGASATGYQTNTILTTNLTTTMAAKNNIAIGRAGTFFTVTNPIAVTLHDVRSNTFYVDNDAHGDNYPVIYLTEQTGAISSGTVNVLDNVVIDPDSTTAPDAAIYLRTSSASQIAACDYNLGYAYTAGTQSPPLVYKDSDGTITEYGTNDVSFDPQFYDKTRNLAAWDSSLGGAGSVASATARLLADPTLIGDLRQYVFDGFRITNSSARSVSSLGATPGAATFLNTARTYAALTNFRSYASTAFGV